MPRSFLGDAPDYILEKWTIQGKSTEYIIFAVDNFDVSCTGRSFMEIEYTADSKRRYCNYNRPIGTIKSTVTSLAISFQFSRATNMLSEYFSAMYSVEKRNQSLNFLLTEEERGEFDLGLIVRKSVFLMVPCVGLHCVMWYFLVTLICTLEFANN